MLVEIYGITVPVQVHIGYNTSKYTQLLFTNKFNELYRPQAPNDRLSNILKNTIYLKFLYMDFDIPMLLTFRIWC